MFRMLRTLPFPLALAALSIFTACGGSSSTKFRLVNAIPNAPQAVDVLIDGKVVETAVTFPNVTPSTGYLSVSSGSRHLQMFPTGTTAGAYFDGNVTFNSGNAYTFVATGSFTNNTIVAPQFTDNNTAPTSGNAELRVVQASPEGLGSVVGQAVDIYIVGPGDPLPATSPDIASVAYQAASAYKTFPAGTYDLLLTPAGVQSLNIRIPNASFSSGKIYTYALVDVPGGGAMSGTPVVLNDN
ncbi:MAG: DUF4397 domain-containing protein [Acidobacteriia bacterium]|nr:DUF4397 domain-containing protein [Terriglobia bacterium]